MRITFDRHKIRKIIANCREIKIIFQNFSLTLSRSDCNIPTIDLQLQEVVALIKKTKQLKDQIVID